MDLELPTGPNILDVRCVIAARGRSMRFTISI